MAKLSFEEYCTDHLGSSTGLMSEEERQDAYRSFIVVTAPKTVPVPQRHADWRLSAKEVRAKLERLVNSQVIDIERNAHLDTSRALQFVAVAREALASKTTKAKLLDLITQNSEISRDFNQQKRGLK